MNLATGGVPNLRLFRRKKDALLNAELVNKENVPFLSCGRIG